MTPGYLAREAGIAAAIFLGCLPLAVVITLLASPFWSWFEHNTGIESLGHSGPAEWCYLLAWGLLVTTCLLLRARRRMRGKK